MNRIVFQTVLALSITLIGCAINSVSQNIVTLNDVMAAPNAFDGRIVKINGFLALDLEGTALYPSKSECVSHKSRTGIWLNIKLAQVQQKYEKCGTGWAIGTFKTSGPYGSGHFGDFNGELTSVTSFGQVNKRFHGPKIVRTSLRDAEVKKLLVGTWKVLPSSKNYSGIYDRQTFNLDGSSTDYEYTDKECGQQVKTTTLQWSLNDGILSLISQDGKHFDNVVENIDSRRLFLRTIDTDDSIHMMRSSMCTKFE